MDFSGEYRIEAPRETVWRALNDPEVLRQSIPGCQEIDKESDTTFSAKVKARLGPVSATFKGRVTLSDLDPPNGYTISGEGQGGVAGFAKGGAKVRLEDAAGGATTLRYTAEGQVGGKLAQIGARLVEGSARKIADDFFGTFNTIVSASAASAAAATVPPPIQPEPAAPPAAPVPAEPVRPAPPGTGTIEILWLGFAALAVLAMLVGAAMMQ